MRPWMIAAAGAAVGVAAAAVSMWLARGALPAGDWTMLVRAEAPQAVLVFLAAYAAVALLVTTAVAVFDLARVRLRLEEGGAPSRREWFAAFARTSLAPLADRLIDLAPEDGPAAASAGLVLQSRFVPAEARREAICHYRDRLVRAQFAGALALLVVIAALGLAQEFAHMTLLGFVVPGRPALAAIAVLVFLAVCARIAAAAMTEPLIGAIARLPRPCLELRLIEKLALVERAAEGRRGAALPAANPVLERLAMALEEGRDTLNDAIARLSASAATLAQTARSIAERSTDGGEAAAIAQLRTAIAELAATIERLPAAAPPAAAEDPSPSAAGANPKRRRAPRRGDLGSELRRLISEFD
ncbi:MAG TPA: hypothetical protein VMF86_02475 [Stellaceae bacterium]|nr:hypothetical protein [Stellaceae bacterium]